MFIINLNLYHKVRLDWVPVCEEQRGVLWWYHGNEALVIPVDLVNVSSLQSQRCEVELHVHGTHTPELWLLQIIPVLKTPPTNDFHT